MHFRRLDLNLLVALDALLAERNITQAGKRLYLTQSAMSGSLARLREFFDDPLLVAAGRKMVLTPLAERLAGPVHDLLVRARATIELQPTFDPTTSRRHFRLMMSDYVGAVMMADAVRLAAERAPGVTFDIVHNNIEAPEETLERAEIDLLIMPVDYLSPGHPHEVLFEDEYVCIAWRGNDRVDETLTVEQYLAAGHVGARFGGIRSTAIDDWFVQHSGVARRMEVFGMNLTSIPQLVVGTRRIATMHRRLAELFATQLPIRLLPPPFTVPPLAEALQWHSAFGQDPGLLWLRALLREVAGSATPVRG